MTAAGVQRAITEREAETSLITGHIHYGCVKLITKSPLHITIIRNPVDRATSDYRYSRQRMLKKRGRQFYQNKRLKTALKYDFESYLSFLLERKAIFGNDASKAIIGNSTHTTAHNCLESEYFHYGTLENLTGFATSLSGKLGLGSFDLLHENRTQKTIEPAQLGAKQRSLIEKIYDQDFECWEQVNAAGL